MLRPYVAGDADDLIRELSVKDVAEGTLNVPHPYPPERAAEFIADQAVRHQSGKGIGWAVTLRDDGRLVGGVGFSLNRVHRSGELAYWVARPEWGKGIATEAARAALAYGFDVIDLHRMEARHYVENPASGAVMSHLGMQYEGRLRQVVWRDGVPRNLELHSILRTDARP